MPPIEGIGRPAPAVTGGRVARGSTGARFALPDVATAGGVGTSAAAAPAAGLSSMLALQEQGGDATEDREARRHGQDLLTLLAELQRSLLRGGDDPAALERLAALADEMPKTADRRLAALISAITLRVRVELARRQV